MTNICSRKRRFPHSIHYSLYIVFVSLNLSLLSCTIEIPFVPKFVDVTTSVGINHVSITNPSADTGGGLAWIDVNNDGHQDLFIPNPDLGPSWLYINLGDGTFTETAATANAQLAGFRSTGAAVGDVNGDGCDDLYVTSGANASVGPFNYAQKNHLLLNSFCTTNRIGFTNATDSAGLGTSITNSTVASFGDIDNDGDLDLYVGNYLPGGNMSEDPIACDENNLYLNDGTGKFTDIATTVGVNNHGCTLGTVFTDYDNDGDLDIFVTNDFSSASTGTIRVDVPDGIYRNLGIGSNGLPNFELATDTNLTDAPNGMGIAVGDYDGDFNLDYYVTSFSANQGAVQNVLHRNNGDGSFTDVTDLLGVGDRGGFPVEGGHNVLVTIGWGVAFLDINNDGYQDIVKSNGRIQGGFGESRFEIQPNALYVNKRNGTFATKGFNARGVFVGHTLDGKIDTSECPFHGQTSGCYGQGRGLAIADYDNDGDIDVMVVNSGQVGGQRPQLFRNTLNDKFERINWLQLRLQGVQSNARGIGAKVKVTSGSGSKQITQMQELGSGTSHGSTNALQLSFGLGHMTYAAKVVVEWPSGCKQVLIELTGGIHNIREFCL